MKGEINENLKFENLENLKEILKNKILNFEKPLLKILKILQKTFFKFKFLNYVERFKI